MIQENKNIIKVKEQKNHINIIKEKIKKFYGDKTKVKDYLHLLVYILIIFTIYLPKYFKPCFIISSTDNEVVSIFDKATSISFLTYPNT